MMEQKSNTVQFPDIVVLEQMTVTELVKIKGLAEKYTQLVIRVIRSRS